MNYLKSCRVGSLKGEEHPLSDSSLEPSGRLTREGGLGGDGDGIGRSQSTTFPLGEGEDANFETPAEETLF